MEAKFIRTANYKRFYEGVTNLIALSPSSPKFGYCEGTYGTGKTTALDKLKAEISAKVVVVRVMENWNFTTAVVAVAQKIGVVAKKRDMFASYEMILEKLQSKTTVLIIDEADKLFDERKMRQGLKILEFFRDLHDEAKGTVIVLIGQEAMAIKIRTHLGGHYISRMSEPIIFEEIKKDDIRLLCNKCEVAIKDDLVEYFTKEFGNLRIVRVILDRLEPKCKINIITEMNLEKYNTYKKAFGLEKGFKKDEK